MGRWAECLSQTLNFAKALFSEIWRRDRTIIRKSAGSLLLWRQSGFAFPVHIAQVNAICQNAAKKSWRAPLHRLRWLRHHQHYAFDGPCSGCSGRLDNADDVSEIMQRSPVGSRFAVSFCCFNKNENLYGGKEMLYTKV